IRLLVNSYWLIVLNRQPCCQLPTATAYFFALEPSCQLSLPTAYLFQVSGLKILLLLTAYFFALEPSCQLQTIDSWNSVAYGCSYWNWNLHDSPVFSYGTVVFALAFQLVPRLLL